MSFSENHSFVEIPPSDLEKGKTLPANRGIQPNTQRPEFQSENRKPEGSNLNAKNTTLGPNCNLNDWSGPDDPDDPHNWSTGKKVYHAMPPALFGFAVTFGTSVYTPALADIMQEFHLQRTTAILGLSLYTLGLGFGPILTAPLSEGHGRRIVYLVSSPIFMLFTLGAGFSKSFAAMCVCRFFAGFTGSPALAVGAGTYADLFVPHQRAVATSLFLMAPFAGPALGPLVGGFVAQYKTWRWTQWCMLFVTLPIFLAALAMKETYKPIILSARAKNQGIEPPKQAKPTKRMIAIKLFRPMHMLITEPTVFLFSLYSSFTFGVLFLFFAAFPYIFQRPPYSFNTSQAGLAFISIAIGVVFGCMTPIIVDRTLYQREYRKVLAKGEKHAQPEHRLYSAMIGSWGMVIGLFWFAWCAENGVHWAATLAAAIPFAWGNLSLFTSTALYLVDVYGPINGASAIAANGVSRYIFGAVFPLFTVQSIGWATSLIGFIAILMLPIPWVFYKWGPAIRKRSKYPTVI